jgi:hypothetical protein
MPEHDQLTKPDHPTTELCDQHRPVRGLDVMQRASVRREATGSLPRRCAWHSPELNQLQYMGEIRLLGGPDHEPRGRHGPVERVAADTGPL